MSGDTLDDASLDRIPRTTDFFSVEIAGIGLQPDGEWMSRIARNLTDVDDGF